MFTRYAMIDKKDAKYVYSARMKFQISKAILSTREPSEQELKDYAPVIQYMMANRTTT